MSDAVEKKWRLSGEVYGRSYDSELEFLGKLKETVPSEHLEGHLRNVRMTNPGGIIRVKCGELSEEDYKKLVEEAEDAELKTDKGAIVRVQPRYVGSVLGSNDDGRGNTICALLVNCEYVALALYNEATKEIVAHEY